MKPFKKLISVIAFLFSVFFYANLFSQELAANQKNSQTASATFSMY